MELSFQLAVVILVGASMLDTALADVSQGLIRSFATEKCWEMTFRDPTNWKVASNPANWQANSADSVIRPRECNMTNPNQLFYYDSTGNRNIKPLVSSTSCVDGTSGADHFFIWNCLGAEATVAHHRWSFTKGNTRPGVMANGILISDEKVCASTGTGSGDDKITWAPCDHVQEHFEFFKIEAGDTGTLPPVAKEDITLAGTGVVLPTSPPTSPPTSLPPLAVTASSGGDPHFKTWSGKNFDFHGACDLVLVDHPGYDKGRGLTIQIRTKQEKWWSFIEAAAIRIGDQMLEVRGADVGENAQFWINGVRAEDASAHHPALELLQEAIGVTIHYKRASEKQHKFRIDLNSAGDAISIGSYKHWVAVNVNTKRVQNFIGATGMMGQYPSGVMVARDGTTLMDDDIDAYGNEWQVLASESSLFSDAGDGVHHPEKCQMPDVASASAKRRLGESVMPLEDAEEACAYVDAESFDQCVFDVLATNDKDMAGAY